MLYNWKGRMCEDYDVEDFFDSYEASVQKRKEIDALCMSCPYIRKCQAVAISKKESGAWGGIYLEDGKISKEFNDHKTAMDWFNLWKAVTIE